MQNMETYFNVTCDFNVKQERTP